MPSPGWNLVRHRSELKVPIRNVRQWLRVLNNSHLTRFWMSAVSRSGHFVSASAGWRGGFVCVAGFCRFLRTRSSDLWFWRRYGDEID